MLGMTDKRKKQWMSKRIALGMAMGLMAGCYGAALPAMADGVPTFTTPITGTLSDQATYGSYLQNKVYTFANGLDLQVKGTMAFTPAVGITDTGSDMTINAVGQPISVTVTPPGGDITGILEQGTYNAYGDKTLTINAKSLSVTANKNTKGLFPNTVSGIIVQGTNSYYEYAKITGDTTVQAASTGNDNVNGVTLHALANVEVDGNLSIDAKNAGASASSGGSSLGSLGGGGAATQVTGVFIQPRALNTGSLLHVKGNLNITSTDKGIYDAMGNNQQGFSGNVDVDGGANIQAKNQAINVERGRIAIKATGNQDVNIKGDILAQLLGTGDPESPSTATYGGTDISLNLNTKNSNLDGTVFADNKSNVHLTLTNGATWNNEMVESTAPAAKTQANGGFTSTLASLAGGDSPQTAGFIIQNSKTPLTIQKYSGHDVLFFKHTGDPTAPASYTGGAVTITAADPNSNLLVQTNNDGISTTDTTALNKVLDTLASKLIYANYAKGENNLTASVGISDGLTASSVVRNVAPITFSATNGAGSSQGESTVVNQSQGANTYSVQIYEENYRAANIQQFWDNKGIRSVSGNTVTYNFNGDTTINVLDTSKTTSTVHKYDPRSGAIVWATDKNGVIDMNNHSLTVVAGKSADYKTDSKDMSGIYVSSGTVEMKNITGLNVNVHNTFLPSGIEVNGEAPKGQFFSGNGEAKLIIHNDDSPAHAVNISIDDAYGTAKGFDGYGAAVEVDGNSSGVAEFQADGLVNFNMTDKQYGIFAIQKGVVHIGGGTMKAVGGNYLIYSSGDVDINSDHSTTRPVDMVGDVRLGANGGNVNIALTNPNDTFQGAVFNDGTGATMTLQVDNGGTFINESQLNKTNTGKGLDKDMWPSVKGTHISTFIGSTTPDTTGFVYQKDANPITIDQYEGNSVVFYDHDNDGTKATDFTAGNILVGTAKPNSMINLETSNANIDMSNVSAVNTVLSNLAYKLVYKDYLTDHTDLKGQVGIADGLTASGVTRIVAPLAYDSNAHGITNGVKTGVSSLPPAGRAKRDTASPAAVPPNPVPPKAPANPSAVPPKAQANPSALPPKAQANPSAVNQPLNHVGDYENPVMRGVRSMLMSPALTWRSYAGDMSGLYANGWWAKATAGKSQFTEGPLQMNTDHHWLQVGYTHLDKGGSYGASVMYHKGDTTGYHASSGKDTMVAGDLYASYKLPKQERLDVSLKVGHVSQDIHAMNSLGLIRVDGTYKGTMTSLAAKLSKRIGSEASYVDPEVQFTYSHMPSANFTMLANDNTTLQVSQRGMHSLVGSVGVTAGKMLNRGHIFAGLHLNHDFAGNGQTSFYAADGGVKTVDYSLGDTWTDMSIGGDYRLAGGGCVYGQLNRGLSGHYKQHWQLQAGVSLKF